MKFVRVTFLLMLLSIILIFTLFYFTVRLDRVDRFVTSGIIDLAKQGHVNLTITNGDLFSIGYKAAQANIVVPPLFQPITLLQPQFSIAPWSVIKGAPSSEISTQLFGGSLTALSRISLLSRKYQTSLKLEKINLPEIPALNLIGITAGQFALSLQDLRASSSGIEGGTGTMSIADLTRKAPSGQLSNLLPMEFMMVPPVNGLNATITARVTATNVFSVDSFKSTSSLGQIEGKATAVLDKELRPKDFAADALVKLTEEGMQRIGPLLSLRGLKINSPQFKMILRGVPASLQIEPVLQ